MMGATSLVNVRGALASAASDGAANVRMAQADNAPRFATRIARSLTTAGRSPTRGTRRVPVARAILTAQPGSDNGRHVTSCFAVNPVERKYLLPSTDRLCSGAFRRDGVGKRL